MWHEDVACTRAMLQPIDPSERFRLRRENARRRQRRRRLTAFAVVALAAAVVTLGARFLPSDNSGAGDQASGTSGTTTASEPEEKPLRPLPDEIRGVHVTMALANLDGKLEEYARMANEGLNTLELDVKDENGEVAFRSPQAKLAATVGAAQNYYRPGEAVKLARDHGLYLIGRVVVFEDPVLSMKRPALAIRRTDGGIWTTSAGLGWTNPYDERVWKYNVDIAAAAARAGFDEIMFDYVRFPSDGDLSAMVFNHQAKEPKAETMVRFVKYARARLHPLGVRVSAALFGLAATRDLGIGQRPGKLGRYLDAIYPMVYPSHYTPGEYNIANPDGDPGRTVAFSLRDFREKLRGRPAKVVPWLQDFSLQHTYTLAQVQAQIDAARRAKSAGYLLWNASGVYTDGGLTAP
jgi:hypothetical protein